ncbi:MAG: hypothetical protein GEU28_04980 [Dehalococcoidia bacterium]|nr:hypothetical protein [Dehalococcoidia bacterium]
MSRTPTSSQPDSRRSAPDDVRLAEMKRRRRHGLIALILSDLRSYVYHVHWHRVSQYPAWRRPLVVLGVVLRFDTLWAVWAFRWKRFFLDWHVPLVPRVIDRFMAVAYQVQIGDHVFVGPGLYLPHGFVVIDGIVEIGANCVLSTWVTLGLRSSSTDGFSFMGPQVGDGLWVGTHSALIGDIRIGNHVSVGAHSMVIHDLPPLCTAAGAPARVIHRVKDGVVERVDPPSRN